MGYLLNLLLLILLTTCTQEAAIVVKKGENYYGKHSELAKQTLEKKPTISNKAWVNL